jgi:hypothetical protein
MIVLNRKIVVLFFSFVVNLSITISVRCTREGAGNLQLEPEVSSSGSLLDSGSLPMQ